MTGVRRRVAALAAAAMVGLVSPTASADPWKDESGHGRGRDDRWEGDWRGGECRKYELFTGEGDGLSRTQPAAAATARG